jgi:hypothetical protein
MALNCNFKFLAASLPHDGPVRFEQTFILTTITSTGLASYNCHLILNDITDSFIWHQAFDNTLSCRTIMYVLNITSVPALNALLTSSYLHAASGMMAHNDATPTSLLLFQVKDGTVIKTATHDPSLFLLCVKDNSEIMAPSLLLFDVKEASAIMAATHTNSTLQLIVASIQWVPSTQHTVPIQKNFIVALHSEGAQPAPTFFLMSFAGAG